MAGKLFIRINISILSVFLRKTMSMNRHIYECWMTIQDVIGPASQWPFLIRRLFWSTHLTHWERILISTFVFVNGLNPVIFFKMDFIKEPCARQSSSKSFPGHIQVSHLLIKCFQFYIY